jgi:hypothetical protein
MLIATELPTLRRRAPASAIVSRRMISSIKVERSAPSEARRGPAGKVVRAAHFGDWRLNRQTKQEWPQIERQ